MTVYDIYTRKKKKNFSGLYAAGLLPLLLRNEYRELLPSKATHTLFFLLYRTLQEGSNVLVVLSGNPW